jgi:membrane associated rhomboid family serine protease
VAERRPPGRPLSPLTPPPSGFARPILAAWERSPITLAILGGIVLVSTLDWLLASWAGFSLRGVLGLSRVDLLQNGALYQPFSWPFPAGDLWSFVLGMLVFWLLGREIEASLIPFRFRYARLLLCGASGAAVLHLLFSDGFLFGPSPLISVLLLTYAFFWPQRRVLAFFLVPVRAWVYVCVLAVLNIGMALRGSGASPAAHLGALLGSAVFLMIAYRDRFSLWLERRRTARRQQRAAVFAEEAQRQKDRVDGLLDKISKQGMESLSSAERRFLDQASRKYYGK